MVFKFNENIEQENSNDNNNEINENSESKDIYIKLFNDDYENASESHLDNKNNDNIEIETNSIYKSIFQDDLNEQKEQLNETKSIEGYVDNDINELFKDDFINIDSSNEKEANFDNRNNDIDLDKRYKPNSEIIINDTVYSTDDEGKIYKINDGLLPNNDYTVNGSKYKTDEYGRIISCDSNPKQTPEESRDLKAQAEAGGKDRKEGDQGGHIIARILGGSKGLENMLAMRGPLNQGPYHTMEKEIDKALSENKDVHIHVNVEYKDDSQRPSKITVRCTIDGKETVYEFDNDEGSTNLLESIEDKVETESYNDLKQEIKDANEDGANMSIISVKTEYDENGNISKVTVIMRDENSGGPNEKRVLYSKEG